ncbi:alpha/beta fold hydrolase [Lutimaribacter marinistellae]|uniref:Alpha/beta fold hydrolase n=1 Tax=Lutimaribacter marinistellae TaxID=1820329 RepID=A0ABV7TEV3_9RHOB
MQTILILLALVVAAIAALLAWGWLTTRRAAREAETLMPPLGRSVDVSGGKIHFVEAGDPAKQTLVMIHGLSGQLQHFTYALVDRLATDHHVIAVDRPGCGFSTRDDEKHATLSEQARMIGEALDQLEARDWVLIGHSLGGAVSLAMALDRPRDVAGLALIAPLTHSVGATPPAFRALEIRKPWLRKMIGHTLAVPAARRAAPVTLNSVFAPEPWPEDFLTRAGGALGLRPEAFITASEDVVHATGGIDQQSPRYRDLEVPGAVLFGAEDPILLPTQQGVPMKNYNLRYEELPGRGHMIPITAPDECEEFIRSVAISTRIPAGLGR